MEPADKIILVADDDLDDQGLLEEVFTKINADLTVHSVGSTKEVLRYLNDSYPQSLPCLIVLDYNMPDFTGAQVTAMILENEKFRHIPILVWSTSNSPVYKKECEQQGARQYFYKPHEYGEVIEMARKMLEFC
jgi:CheY-like chemotaxis protein